MSSVIAARQRSGPVSARVLLLAGSLALAACAVSDEDAADNERWADSAAWLTVGYGVSYSTTSLTDGHAAILYGGYLAHGAWVRSWLTALTPALEARGVAHLYAVQGPATAGYSGLEIANSKLRAHLAQLTPRPQVIHVHAHSSGVFVAHELLNQLRRQSDGDDWLKAVSYSLLDAGGCGGQPDTCLTTELVHRLGAIRFLSAYDPGAQLASHNAGAIDALAQTYPTGTKVVLQRPHSGCRSSWCLHDSFANCKPWNPDMYDLQRDYQDFDANHPLATDILEWRGTSSLDCRLQ